MNSHDKKVGVSGSRRLSRGEGAWEFVAFVGIVTLAVIIMVRTAMLTTNKPDPETTTDWKVQTLPVKDDEVMCYILTTPKGAVDLECLPYHYEVEENEDVQQETRT